MVQALALHANNPDFSLASHMDPPSMPGVSPKYRVRRKNLDRLMVIHLLFQVT